MARPLKDSPERRRRICAALADGNTRRAACALGGISEDTLARWLKRAADFADAIKKAEGDAEVRNVAIISKAAQAGTWQAAAWWLERRYPHDYGRSIQQVEHSGPGGGPLRLTFRIAHPLDASPEPPAAEAIEGHTNGRLPEPRG